MLYGNIPVNESTLTNAKDNAILILGGQYCSIKVKNDEGLIPHFHLLKGNDEACIQIKQASYFNHNKSQQLILTSKECKELNEWMRNKPTPGDEFPTNWQRIAMEWNRFNNSSSSQFVNLNMNIPNYSNIKPYK